MLTYVITGLIGGGVYAISALGLVLTYRSSRIFNFGHGAIAYLTARLFWELTASRSSGGNAWGLWPAALFCVLLVAPLIGFLLWAGLFRRLSDASATVKVVTTVGKPGVQVASSTKRPAGYVFAHVEGANRPTVNGTPLVGETVHLKNGDVIELAGTQMQFVQG